LFETKPDAFVTKYGRAEYIPLWALSRWLPADGDELENLIGWGGLGVLLSLAAGGLVLRRRRRMHDTHQNGSNTVEDRSGTAIIPSDYTDPVSVDTVPEKADAEPPNAAVSTLLRVEPSAEANVLHIVARTGRRVPVKSPMDIKLLTLLLKHACDAEIRYTTSDEIDEALIPTHPSPDYIRRMRNLTLARLENLFLEASGIVPGETASMFILRRNTASDRRKFEYRLNDELVAVPPAVI
jgi:LPXTG-motif cell wall-anchored protein